MEALRRSESRRRYSWWWASHICPRNSKWLQETLADMDNKIKEMIKLIDEDGDTFAKRAEMFYKKRPEFMKLLEEFHRAYRALAERYDHATGALRQAHRAMTKAFPKQIPLMPTDGSPSGSSAPEEDPDFFEMPPTIHDLLDALQQDALSASSHLNETFAVGEETTCPNTTEERVRQGLEEKEKFSEYKLLEKEISWLLMEEQDLKSQIMSESARDGRAETEIQSLKHTLSEVKSEKEAALLRCQKSEERIACLEMEISHTQEEIGKLNDQMLMGAKHLSVALEKCLMLEKVNESLQLELEALGQREKEQQEQLDAKQKQLKELQISLKDEKLKSFQAEMAFLTLEKLHVESQNEMRLLILQIQSGVKKLKDMSQNLSKDSMVKLEDEVALHVKGNKVLPEELSCLEEDANDLEQTHHVPTEEIQVVHINVDSLQPLVEELKHEDEQDTPSQNLKQMKEMPEKNAFMENSVSNADAELERLREKIKKTLEDSSEYFCGKISIRRSEESVPVSQVDSNAQKMEKHLEKNTFLENSLSDANIELQDLREKLEGLGKYCQPLHDQNSDLLAQKITLVSQVESSSKSLENMESKYAELESKYLNLEKERDLALHQVRDLQELLKNEKEEHQTLIQSNKSQLSILENKIFSLQEEIQYREEELEVEQHKVLNAQIEIFILRRCLCDMEEKIMVVHLAVHQKNEEASGHAENLISQLEQDHLIQEENIRSLSAKYEKLREGVRLILKTLVAEEYGSLDDIKDELLLQIILCEVRCLLKSISEAKDENLHLVSEKSVIIGFLEQFGQHGADLRSENKVLDQESKTKTEELLLLHSKRHELFDMNEKLRQDMQASNQRQEPLKAEMDNLYGQSSDLLEVRSLQKEISRLQEENCSLSKRLDSMRVKQSMTEEENSIIREETMALEYLSLIFRSFVAEKALEIHLLKNNVDHRCGARDELSQENRLTVAKLGVPELEDKHIKDTVANLEECRRRLVMIENDFCAFKRVSERLHQQMGVGRNLLMQKDMKLLQANQKIQEAQDMITELHRNMEGLKLGMDEVEVAREKREKKISTLPEDNAHETIETACLDRENEILKEKLYILQKEVGELRRREEHLTSKLQRGRDEVKYCEEKIASLIADIQSTTINAAINEERALELTATSDNLETSAMVQRKVLNEETTLKNVYVGELKQKLEAQERENRELKTHLTAYVHLVMSLGGAVALLEEHILELANHSSAAKQEIQGVPLVPLQIKKSSQEPIKDQSAKDLAGILRLQQLHAKVEALQKAIMDARSLLGQQRFDSDANLEAARKEIEALKSKGILDDEITKAKHEQKMKDMQLDYFSGSSQYENSFGSNEQRKMGNAETNDQEIELWGITEGGHKNEIEVTPTGTTEHYLESHQIKTVEEGKGKHPVCDLGFNKLELPKRIMMESHQEWNRRIIERLSSDAQRLLVLQTSVQELKTIMETSEEVNKLRGFQFDTVKGQLKEAEAIILQLIVTNSKLTKKAKEFIASPDNLLEENVDTARMRQRIISERAQRVSERIGKLELKLHKIQYISLKLEEEHVNKRTRAKGGRSKIILWDYIYGRINSRPRKKAPRCGCFRFQLKDD